MGNCLLGGGLGSDQQTNDQEVVRVIRSNGGIMEFLAPITVESITLEFPGHGLFLSHDLSCGPLSHHEELPGGSYYLLPLDMDPTAVRQGHVRSSSIPTYSCQGMLKRSYTDVLWRYNIINKKKCGEMEVWKVKLVISPETLAEIVSQEGRTQELIDSVRTVARCRSCSAVSHFGVGFSDHWSFSSSRNHSSITDGILLHF